MRIVLNKQQPAATLVSSLQRGLLCGSLFSWNPESLKSKDLFRASGFEDCGISGFRDFRISGFEDFLVSGCWDFRISGCQDCRISGSQGFRMSGFQDCRISGLQDSKCQPTLARDLGRLPPARATRSSWRLSLSVMLALGLSLSLERALRAGGRQAKFLVSVG